MLLAVFAGLVACQDSPSPAPAGSSAFTEPGEEVAAASTAAAAVEAAATDPRIMLASPEATNYAPPDWPLNPGDEVTRRDWVKLDLRYGNHWGMAVVWVVSERGLPGALPFGAGFAFPKRPGDHPVTYVGHVPMRPVNGKDRVWARAMERELPESLRGVVIQDHIPSDPEWDQENNLRKAHGWLEYLENRRGRYHGEAVSW